MVPALTLEALGWKPQQLSELTAGLAPARVIADYGTSLKVATPAIVTAELTGKMAHHSNRQAIPKVGDWVGLRLLDNGPAVIEMILPRTSELARKVAGQQTVRQVIAANVNIAFVLLALDADFSVERLQRYLYQLSVSHIEPIIVLNKADKTADLADYLHELKSLKLPIIVSQATAGIGVAEILEHIKPGQTALLLGSSGVGKSTLTNQLLGEVVQATNSVRESDDTGRHTTVHRELFVLPNGGLLIDTPGIRELQLWGTTDDLAENFEDISRLATQCRFSTCHHRQESGCAVRAALEAGQLDRVHYANYLKMRDELAQLEKKTQVRQQLANRRSTRTLKRRSNDKLADDDNYRPY